MPATGKSGHGQSAAATARVGGWEPRKKRELRRRPEEGNHAAVGAVGSRRARVGVMRGSALALACILLASPPVPTLE